MARSTRNKKRDSYVDPPMNADPEKILREARKARNATEKAKKTAGTGKATAKAKKPSKKKKKNAPAIETIEEEEEEPANRDEGTVEDAIADLRQATPAETTTHEEPALQADETSDDTPADLHLAAAVEEAAKDATTEEAAAEPHIQPHETTDAPGDVLQATPADEIAETAATEEPARETAARTDAATNAHQTTPAEETTEPTLPEQAASGPDLQPQDTRGDPIDFEQATTVEQTSETTAHEQTAGESAPQHQETSDNLTDLEQATAVKEAAEKTLQEHEAEKKSENKKAGKERPDKPDNPDDKETPAEKRARGAQNNREFKIMDEEHYLRMKALNENAGMAALLAEAEAREAAKSEESGKKRPADEQSSSAAANKRQRTEHSPTDDSDMPQQYQGIMEETLKPQTTKRRLSESEANDGIPRKRPKYERQNPCEVFAKKLTDWQSKLTKPLAGPATVGGHISMDTIFQALASVSEAVNDFRVAKKQTPLYGLIHPKALTEPDEETHPIVRPRTGALVPLQRSSDKRIHYSLLVLRQVSEDPQMFVGDHYDSNRSLRSAFENTMPPKANARKAILNSGWAGDDDEAAEKILDAIKSNDNVCDIPAGHDWAVGLHVILNGWVCVFGLEHNKTPRLDADFYEKAVQVVNLALRGLMDSFSIINFLQCYEYIKLDDVDDDDDNYQPEWVKQNRRFHNTKLFLTPESLDDHILKSTGHREWLRRTGRANRAAPAPKRKRPGQHNQHVEEDKEGDDNLAPADRFPADFLNRFITYIPDTSIPPPYAQNEDSSRRQSTNPFLNKAPEYEPEELGSDYADSLEGEDLAEELRNLVGDDDDDDDDDENEDDDEDEDEGGRKKNRKARQPSPVRFDWRGRAIPKKAEPVDDLDDLFDANQEVNFGDDEDDKPKEKRLELADEDGSVLADEDDDENGPTDWDGDDYYGDGNGDGNGDNYDENGEDNFDDFYD